MLNRSPKSEMIERQMSEITKLLDTLLANILGKKFDKREAEATLVVVSGFINSISNSLSIGSMITTKSYSIASGNLEILTTSLNKNCKEITFIKNFKVKLPLIAFSLRLYALEVQTECDLEHQRKLQAFQSPPVSVQQKAMAMMPRLPTSAARVSSSPQRIVPLDVSQASNLFSHSVPAILPNSAPSTVRLGGLNSYLRHLHNMKYDTSCDFMLDKLPEPTAQIGYTCGYKGLKFIIDLWNMVDGTYPKIPYLLTGDEKKKTASLMSLGKQKAKAGVKDLEGVGAIYDINSISDILAETIYHSQIVQFDKQKDLSKIIMRGLELKCPLLLPVDMTQHSILIANGQHAHYVVVIGFNPKDPHEEVYFVSHDIIYCAPLNYLFNSNINLNAKDPETFIKQIKGAEWIRFSHLNEKFNLTVTTPYKIFSYKKTDLKNLKGHAAFVYPKSLRDKLEKEFKDSSLSMKSS